MKKFLSLLLTLLFSFSCLTCFGFINVFAEDKDVKFLRVITSDTPFYSNPDLTGFITFLPMTYYVKVLSENENFYYVEFAPSNLSIDGYVPKNLLFFDGEIPENPYPNFQVKTCENCMIYSSLETKTPVAYLFEGRTLNYIGFAFNSDGEKVYSVFYNDVMGYIPYKSVYPFTIPDHPTPKTYEKPTPDVPENGDAVGNVLKWVIIGLLLFAGILALFLIKRPKKEKSAFYDENDFN